MDKTVKKWNNLSMKKGSLLVLSDEISGIFNLYYILHGVRISLFSPSGERIYPRKDQPDCDYCRMVRNDLGYEGRCLDLDKSMIRKCLEENRMISYRCHGGMQEAALPLIVDGKPEGCVMLGQFRCEKEPERSPYRKDWRDLFGNDLLDRAFKASSEYPREKIPVLLELYRVLLKYVSKEKMVRSGNWIEILPIIERIEKNPRLNPSLEEAASWIAKSPSSTTRLFKKITGYSYKTYRILYKIDLAEDMMQRYPKKTISEIAWETGFSDPLYFSRLYRRYRGYSPREFRQGADRLMVPENQIL